jgi:hypothetical protein
MLVVSNSGVKLVNRDVVNISSQSPDLADASMLLSFKRVVRDLKQVAIYTLLGIPIHSGRQPHF